MSISSEEFKKLLRISKIEVTDVEAVKNDISRVIDWIDEIQEIDTNGIEPLVNLVQDEKFSLLDVDMEDVEKRSTDNVIDCVKIEDSYFKAPGKVL